ncbi:MAG: UDP-4-amino-4,6-dideoxy-N-acetyl-beta-L-altrosamine transaminase [Candidatus Anammoxibacter sp.]
MTKISYGRQTIEDEDVNAIVEAVRSGWLTQGFHIEAFEEAIADYCNAKYAVACCNGTAALHLAYLAVGITGNDAIITSPNTFVATANAALFINAKPYLTDIDPDTLNIDHAKIEETISNIDTENINVKAIVPVHFAGLPCNMEAIANIAAKNDLLIVEDACHALGSKWQDSSGIWHKVGNCSHSKATVFSFHPVKSITTGEGGVITTNDKDIYERLKLYRSHGIIKDPDKFVNHDLAYTTNKPNPWYYEMHELGFNYRITDLQCALGISQIKKIDKFMARRKEIVLIYNKLLGGYNYFRLPVMAENVSSSNHLYPVQIDFDELGITKNELFARMSQKDIALQVHYIPIHLQPYYQRTFGFKEGDFPVAEEYYRKAVSLPIYPLLTDNDLQYISESMIEILESSGKFSAV